MKSRLLFISCLTLVAVSAAAGHTPSGIDKFVEWLSHIPGSKTIINNPLVVVEHNGKYCPVVYNSDRSNADAQNISKDDIRLGDGACIDKSDYEKTKFHIFHPLACPNPCGGKPVGSLYYSWCAKNPVPPSEPKMNVDIFFGGPNGAHIDKQSANSSGRPSTCPAP